jgi:hypothetical protein
VLVVILLAGTMLGSSPVLAQTLRGTVDDDPIQRTGRTAGEPVRNQVTPTGRRADNAEPLRQNVRRRTAGSAGAAPQAAAEPAGAAPTTAVTRRPAQQNFRSLERPINTAVTAPGPEQIVHQGLTPPPPPAAPVPP